MRLSGPIELDNRAAVMQVETIDAIVNYVIYFRSFRRVERVAIGRASYIEIFICITAKFTAWLE